MTTKMISEGGLEFGYVNNGERNMDMPTRVNEKVPGVAIEKSTTSFFAEKLEVNPVTKCVAQLCVSIVDYRTMLHRQRRGVCSCYLDELLENGDDDSAVDRISRLNGMTYYLPIFVIADSS